MALAGQDYINPIRDVLTDAQPDVAYPFAGTRGIGEQAIRIWAPIITIRCPECGNAESYHDSVGCEYDEIPPEEWSRGAVTFHPTTVFGISQIAGEPLPELETAATDDAGELVPTFVEAATASA